MGIPQTDRRDFVMDYTDGLTDSLTELYNNHPLVYFKMINDMEELVKKQTNELDKLRKRVFASVGGWLKLIGRDSNAELIKTIACRATGYDSFNSIPKHRLQNVYNTFLHKQKDFKALDEGLKKHLTHLTYLN
jgi:hypothetical protein